MSRNPLVSIVVPVFNGEQFVVEALESALRQDYNNIEVLVVDDGSTDRTWPLLQRYCSHAKVKLLFHEGRENKGVSRSRKLGIDTSNGKYIAFLDADDAFIAGKISHQVEILENNPDFVLCHGNIEPVFEGDDSPNFVSNFALSNNEYQYYYRDESYFLERNRICNSTSLIRGDALKGLNFDAPQLFQYEDFLLWILLSEKGKYYFTPRLLVEYRYHEDSATNRVLNNPLVAMYSRLELYLTAITKVDNSSVFEQLVALIKEYLSRLIMNYAGDDSNADIDTIVKRVLFKDVSEEYVEVTKKLALKKAELEEIKSSFLYKLCNKMTFKS